MTAEPSPRQVLPDGAEPLHGMIREDRWAAMRELLNLTGRELEIVQQLFARKSEREIGEILGISEHTVHTHLGRMYRKLDVRGLPGLLLRVFSAYIAAAATDPASAERRPVSPGLGGGPLAAGSPAKSNLLRVASKG